MGRRFFLCLARWVERGGVAGCFPEAAPFGVLAVPVAGAAVVFAVPAVVFAGGSAVVVGE